MRNKKIPIIFMCSILAFTFLFNFDLTNINNDNNIDYNMKKSAIYSLTIEDLTIEDGVDLYEDYNYLFSAVVYDPSDPSRIFDSGYIETEESLFSSTDMDNVQYNHTDKIAIVYISFNLKCIWRYRYVMQNNSDDYISNWIYFEVIASEPNVEMISEVSYTTKWDFIGSFLSEIDLYDETFNTISIENQWKINNTGIIDFIDQRNDVDDAYVYSKYPNNNYGTNDELDIGTQAKDGKTRESYIKFESSEYLEYGSNNSYLEVSTTSSCGSHDIAIYECGDFDESTITWNNKPSNLTSMISLVSMSSGNTYYIDLGHIDNDQFVFKMDDYVWNYVYYTEFKSKEHCDVLNIPKLYTEYSKIFHGNSLLMIQTNITELLNVRSLSNLDMNLLENDRIEVTFSTTSQNAIDLKLYDNDSEVDSYEISETGNVNYNTRTVTISVSGDVYMDQLGFEGTFEDTKNLIIDNIRIYRYNDTSGLETHYVGAEETKQEFMDYNIDYIVQVYYQNVMKEIFNITSGLELETLVFNKIETEAISIAYYDQNNDFLDFMEFNTYVNYTYNGIIHENELMSSNIFRADSDTMIYLDTYDIFGIKLNHHEIVASTFINVDLNVNMLEIKNEASKYIIYDMELESNSVVKSGNIFSMQSKIFYISSGNYEFNYTNMEDYSNNTVLISLSSSEILIIDSIYYEVYFNLYDMNSRNLDANYFQFYINGDLRNFGINVLNADLNELVVLDYFNASLYDMIVDLSLVTIHDIFVDVYNLLVINNDNTQNVKLCIERNGIVLEDIVSSQSSNVYVFKSNENYQVSVYDFENNLIGEELMLLDSNNKILAFGEYTALPIDLSLLLLLVFIIFIGTFGLIFIGMYNVSKNKRMDDRYKHVSKKYAKKNDTNKYGKINKSSKSRKRDELRGKLSKIPKKIKKRKINKT